MQFQRCELKARDQLRIQSFRRLRTQIESEKYKSATAYDFKISAFQTARKAAMTTVQEASMERACQI